MANADDLRRLADEMTSAYEERVNSVSEIKGQTAEFLTETRNSIIGLKRNVGEMLAGFNADDKDRADEIAKLLEEFDGVHQEMATELHAKLTSEEEERKTVALAEIKERNEEVSNMLAEFAEQDTERKEAVGDMLGEFNQEDQERKEAVGDMLGEFNQEDKARAAEITKLLKGFDKAHAAMAAELKAKLANDEKERKVVTLSEITDRSIFVENLLDDFADEDRQRRNEITRMLGEFNQEDKARAAEITKLLKGFDKAHAAMAAELKAKLANDEKERKTATLAEIKARNEEVNAMLAEFAEQDKARVAEISKLISEFNDQDKERAEEIKTMLSEFNKEQAETAAAWKKLLAGMQSLREKVTITGPAEIEAAVEVTTVDEAIEVEEPEEAEPEEEEHKEEIAEEEIEEDLGGRILDLLEDHTEGLKMTQVADMLGIENWRTLIPIMRELLDADEIRKENSIYYAT